MTLSNTIIKKDNCYLKTFGIGLLVAFCMFIPFILKDGGRFFFYGDFNAQQIPFYIHAHDMIRSGNFGWSSITDLGSGFIGSYSFYLLGSPFFWLTIPFPNDWVSYMMGYLLILKFACASLTGYIYLKRYVKNPDFAVLGGLLYAFSGFSVYNIFFNHFHEPLIIFPVLLASLDAFVIDKKRGYIIFTVLFSVLFNYYFFIGQAVFCVIYFFVRLFHKSYTISPMRFLFLTIEVLLGVGAACILLFPSLYILFGNDRISNMINGWDALLYEYNQRYVHILQSMFFPPDLPARANFAPDSHSNWASLGAWLPLFGMSGVIAWIQVKRKHWLKKLIYILTACAFVPFLNSMFQMFNGAYYARWFYMLVLVFVLATVSSLESTKVDFKRAIKWNFAIVSVIAILIGCMPELSTQNDTKTWTLGLMDYPSRFWTYVAISLISLATLIYIFKFAQRKQIAKNCTIAVCLISFFYGLFFIATGKTQSIDPSEHLIPYALGDRPELDEIETARSDFYESFDNSGMYWDIPSINCFHSVVSSSIMDFYEFIGMDRAVGSRPETKYYGVRGLTSVRWLFDDDHDDEYFAGENYFNPKMQSFDYYGNMNGFDIWENSSYIPMGFSYTSFITESEAMEVSKNLRHLLLLKTAVVPDEDANIWGDYFQKYDIDDAIFTNSEYEKDCIARNITASKSFEYTNYGFKAIYDSNIARPVFFSVPYDKGWTAVVNGSKAKILVTNIGFMSVVVPAGQDIKIEFVYNTPGLNEGIVLSGASIILIFLYFRFTKNYKDKIKTRKSKMKCGNFKNYCMKNKIEFTNKNCFLRDE